MKTHQAILESLKQQFEEHKTSMLEYENQIFPLVVKTKWATEPQFHLALLKIERSRLPKGKVYEVKKDSASVKLGYDQQNRIVYEEREDRHSSGGYKKFIFYEADKIWVYKYSDNSIEGIEYLILEKGIPVRFASFEKGVVNSVDKYVYEEGRLAKIDAYVSYEAFGQEPQMPNYEIVYNRLGDIEEIIRIDEPSDFFPEGQHLVIFKKHNYSTKALTEILISESVNLIKQQLKKQSFDKRKCLLVFISNAFNSDDWLPPRFSIVAPQTSDNPDLKMHEFIDFETISFEKDPSLNDRFNESAMLLMQDLELKEKFGLPFKILLKIAKEIKLFCADQFGTKGKLVVLPLDFPDDYYEPVASILARIYSKKEINKISKFH